MLETTIKRLTEKILNPTTSDTQREAYNRIYMAKYKEYQELGGRLTEWLDREGNWLPLSSDKCYIAQEEER